MVYQQQQKQHHKVTVNEHNWHLTNVSPHVVLKPLRHSQKSILIFLVHFFFIIYKLPRYYLLCRFSGWIYFSLYPIYGDGCGCEVSFFFYFQNVPCLLWENNPAPSSGFRLLTLARHWTKCLLSVCTHVCWAIVTSSADVKRNEWWSRFPFKFKFKLQLKGHIATLIRCADIACTFPAMLWRPECIHFLTNEFHLTWILNLSNVDFFFPSLNWGSFNEECNLLHWGVELSLMDSCVFTLELAILHWGFASS